LPHSKLEVDLPLIGQFPVVPAADEGLLPDIGVMPSVEEISAGKDSELDAVRRLIDIRRCSSKDSLIKSHCVE
jgi:hypothetical protein